MDDNNSIYRNNCLSNRTDSFELKIRFYAQSNGEYVVDNTDKSNDDSNRRRQN